MKPEKDPDALLLQALRRAGRFNKLHYGGRGLRIVVEHAYAWRLTVKRKMQINRIRDGGYEVRAGKV